MDNVKKYQIFVSSTYEDLKEERSAAIQTILGMEHIPIGMEMFNASDSTQWDIIRRTIDTSDYYIVIIGLRYGTTFDDGISYTEKEYDYAASKGIPILALIKDEKAPTTPSQRENDSKKQKNLDKFREKAKKRAARFWITKDELSADLVRSLYSAMRDTPRRGWIRTPTDYEDISVADRNKLESLFSLFNEKGELVLNGGTASDDRSDSKLINESAISTKESTHKNAAPGGFWSNPISGPLEIDLRDIKVCHYPAGCRVSSLGVRRRSINSVIVNVDYVGDRLPDYAGPYIELGNENWETLHSEGALSFDIKCKGDYKNNTIVVEPKSGRNNEVIRPYDVELTNDVMNICVPLKDFSDDVSKFKDMTQLVFLFNSGIFKGSAEIEISNVIIK